MNKEIKALYKHRAFHLEVKSLQEDGAFAGYASVFNLLDNQRDVVRPGAFAASLAKRNMPVQLLWQHQWESPIGVIQQIFEDRHGLYVQGKLLLEVARAKEAYALIKAGALRGMSIGFTVKKAARNPQSGVRELLALELWEVSLVTMPANDAAQVTVVKRHMPQLQEAAFAKLLHAMTCAEHALGRLR